MKTNSFNNKLPLFTKVAQDLKNNQVIILKSNFKILETTYLLSQEYTLLFNTCSKTFRDMYFNRIFDILLNQIVPDLDFLKSSTKLLKETGKTIDTTICQNVKLNFRKLRTITYMMSGFNEKFNTISIEKFNIINNLITAILNMYNNWLLAYEKKIIDSNHINAIKICNQLDYIYHI